MKRSPSTLKGYAKTDCLCLLQPAASSAYPVDEAHLVRRTRPWDDRASPTEDARDGSGARLRRRVWALGPRGSGSRVPEALRQEIVAYAHERHGDGAGLRQIACETGITRETIRNWLRAPSSDPGPRPVVASTARGAIMVPKMVPKGNLDLHPRVLRW